MPEDPINVTEYFARLNALRTGHNEGWFEWLAGDVKNSSGRHVVRLVDGVRLLDRDAYWWCLGVADTYSQGKLITARPRIPELVTVDQAADMLGLTPAGVSFRIARGQLLVLHPGDRRRLLAAEVRHAARVKKHGDIRRIEEITRLLPKPIGDLDPELLGLQAALALQSQAERTRAAEVDRRLTALNAAQAAKLIRYLWMDPTKDLYAASITVGEGTDADTTVRELAGPTVWPWLQGVCDRANRSDIVPPRLAT
jgi:hypothetical protein